MRSLRFQYKDQYTVGRWATLNCEAESLEDAIKFYGLDREECEYKLVFDVQKKNCVKREKIDKFLEGIDVKDAHEVTKKFNPSAQNTEFDLENGLVCLAPFYEDYEMALKVLARDALSEEISDEDFAEIFWDAKKESYPDYDFIDWKGIHQEIIEHSEEVEYSTSSANIDTDSVTVGWNYQTENTIEDEVSYVSNYEELVKEWNEQIVATLKGTLKDTTFVGGISKEEFFEDTYNIVEMYKEYYPMPTEEEVNDEVLTEYEHDYDGEDY